MVKLINTFDNKVPNNGLVSEIQRDLDEVNLKKMIEDVDKKIPDTSKFIETCPTRQNYVPRTSSECLHMALYVTPRNVSGAGHLCNVLKMSILMVVYWIFYIFPDSNCTPDNALPK